MNATEIWGANRYTVYEILERSLNFKNVKVFDTVDEKRVLNTKQTLLGQEKQENMTIAENMNIEMKNLVWNAAFHNEGNHPHE